MSYIPCSKSYSNIAALHYDLFNIYMKRGVTYERTQATNENRIYRPYGCTFLCGIYLLQIRIPLPGGDATSIHLGNAICVLGALLLGGLYGGLGGAIGMTIGDLLDPVYIVYAPKTFLLKLCIGLITGLVAHKIGHITKETDNRKVWKWVILAAAAGLLFNVIFDPLIGYLYKLLILGKPAAELTLAWNVTATSINAVTSTIVQALFTWPFAPPLKRPDYSWNCSNIPYHRKL